MKFSLDEGAGAAPPGDIIAPPGTPALFLTFLGVGLSGFGGVLPFARRALVERRRWLGEAEFNESLALCQTLPGPNIVNLSVVVGRRFAGLRGALAAVAGLTVAPVALVLVLAEAWARLGSAVPVQGAMRALSAAAAGLVIAAAARMARPVLADAPATGGAVMAAVFVSIAILRAPLGPTLAILGPLSLLAAWRRVG